MVTELMGRGIAAAADAELAARTFGDEARALAKGLYYIIVQTVSGRALTFVRMPERGNGLLV